MLEAIVQWNGAPGGTGYSVFYFADGTVGIPGALQAFYTTLQGRVTNDITWVIPSSGKQLDPANGNLVGSWSETPVANVSGTSVSSYAAPTGGVIQWNTDTVVNNRIVKGRTFIVPLASGSYDTDGSLIAATLTDLQTAGDGLVTFGTPGTVIWSRPIKDQNGNLLRAGTEATVQSATARDYAAILTGRRD